MVRRWKWYPPTNTRSSTAAWHPALMSEFVHRKCSALSGGVHDYETGLGDRMDLELGLIFEASAPDTTISGSFDLLVDAPRSCP